VTAVEDAHPSAPATGPEPRADVSRRRRLVWAALGAAAIAVGAGAWLGARSATQDGPPAAAGPFATTTIERGRISATESWDGTLEYERPLTVKSGAAGTVTRLVDQGARVQRGDELYRVDERPAILLYGAVPMYRDLAPGASGLDVRQLEANLRKLGYDGFTVDRAYTASTAAAVRAWQADAGLDRTGTVARRDVVFVPAGGRVDAVRIGVADVVRPGSPVLEITGTERVVSFEADLDDRDRFDIDAKVTVVLPGADEIAGRVSALSVLTVASGQTESESLLQVEIALPRAPDALVGTPVEVIVAIDERTDVLLVPVSALLALAEGGYGLEVVREDGTTRVVPVDTGLFADGKVEVRGVGIAEGAVVGVAGR
jgi:peptidoglycan hydrolase-like protein with peptidoglycan-binding domain